MDLNWRKETGGIKCCKNCKPPKRHTACWDQCEQYKKEKVEYERLKEKRKEALESAARITSYEVNKIAYADYKTHNPGKPRPRPKY